MLMAENWKEGEASYHWIKHFFIFIFRVSSTSDLNRLDPLNHLTHHNNSITNHWKVSTWAADGAVYLARMPLIFRFPLWTIPAALFIAYLAWRMFLA